ncbi:MAG: anaerobic ribonucleoside-triphosphate reductase activating protein [Candidatus Nealsonbacteria bacterium]
MNIGGIQHLTLIDYPSKLATTVFLSSCNFRCGFCYSSELVLPEKIKNQPKISENDFFDFLEIRKELLEGVVICGGEPTVNEELPKFIQKIKDMGYVVKLDTNGSNPEMLKDLINKKMIDYVAMDIKGPLEKSESNINSKYEKIIGVKIDLDKIKNSIDIIKNSGIDYEFRTTIVPGIHTKKDIISIVKEISGAKKYYLQNFRPEKTIDLVFEKMKPYSDEYILNIKKAISPFFEVCEIR